MKVRGLALNYGCDEEAKKGVDLWCMDAANYVDECEEFPFKSAWEAIRHLAAYFFDVWNDERTLEGKECCDGWRLRKNKEVFTEVVLKEREIDPDELVEVCPVCRNRLQRRAYQHEWLEDWLVEEYGTSPGYGGADFWEYGYWDRIGAWEVLVKSPQDWFVIEENAERVLALAVPEGMIPEKDRALQREKFEFYFDSFSPGVRKAYEEWKAR